MFLETPRNRDNSRPRGPKPVRGTDPPVKGTDGPVRAADPPRNRMLKSARSDFRGACEKALREALLTVHPNRIRHFQPPKFQCLSSQCALHGLRALDWMPPARLLRYGRGSTWGLLSTKHPPIDHVSTSAVHWSSPGWPESQQGRKSTHHHHGIGNCAACYRIEKRGTPENSWGGCWEECCENSGCWRECWRGCCSWFLSKENPPRSTLASTPSSTPNFRSTLPSTLPSYFLGFPVSLFCSRPRSSQQKSRDVPPKSSVSLGFRGACRTFWPLPLHMEDPHPTQRVWVPFFSPRKLSRFQHSLELRQRDGEAAIRRSGLPNKWEWTAAILDRLQCFPLGFQSKVQRTKWTVQKHRFGRRFLWMTPSLQLGAFWLLACLCPTTYDVNS